ncbi:hypothetical protein PRZ48_012814 [Zasmidium cellare]|uniref:Uncharacterized protein n=1 Tax=Zasmidium cellare TaxID=395010 RepID=A0ABR0E648_ZASCE|nr:hypothetical protein PRZ48_012814 [Zasmidium cellare]
MSTFQQPISQNEEKKDEESPSPASRDTTSDRLEEGPPAEPILCNEEEAFARIRAEADSPVPICITFSHNDPENPRHFPRWKKWYIVGLVSYFNLISSLGASGYSSGSAGIAQTFDVSSEVATVGLSMFVIGFAIGPLALAPLSGSVSLTNAGGSISDTWSRDENGWAMLWYGLFSTISQPLSLVIAGYVDLKTGWRWIFWVQMIIFGGSWLLTVTYMPEIRHTIVLEKKVKRVRKQLIKEDPTYAECAALKNLTDAHNHGWTRSLHRLFARNLTRPFRFLFTKPIAMGAAAYLGFIFAIQYMFNESFSLVFGNNHHFNIGESGLSFLGIVVGATIAACFHPLQERYHRRRVTENGGKGVPEARMWSARLGGFFLPISLFCYQTYSASALAGANVSRNVLGAAFPLFTNQMKLGWISQPALFANTYLVVLPGRVSAIEEPVGEVSHSDQVRGERADMENYVALVKEMRASFGSQYGVSLTLAPDYWYLRGFDAKAMEQYVDFFGFSKFGKTRQV